MTPIPTIPVPAWEQVGIICLFVVMLLSILGGIFLLAKTIMKVLAGVVKDISKQFQDFIVARDTQWQRYFEDREKAFKERNEEVASVLRKLVEEFQDHSTETREAIAVMKERTERRTQPRK